MLAEIPHWLLLFLKKKAGQIPLLKILDIILQKTNFFFWLDELGFYVVYPRLKKKKKISYCACRKSRCPVLSSSNSEDEINLQAWTTESLFLCKKKQPVHHISVITSANRNMSDVSLVHVGADNWAFVAGKHKSEYIFFVRVQVFILFFCSSTSSC